MHFESTHHALESDGDGGQAEEGEGEAGKGVLAAQHLQQRLDAPRIYQQFSANLSWHGTQIRLSKCLQSPQAAQICREQGIYTVHKSHCLHDRYRKLASDSQSRRPE